MRVELHPSARRHGVPDNDIAHAFLELVVLTTAEGEQLVVHAMPLRPKYRRLLES
jgi:hypothetical protein